MIPICCFFGGVHDLEVFLNYRNRFQWKNDIGWRRCWTGLLRMNSSASFRDHHLLISRSLCFQCYWMLRSFYFQVCSFLVVITYGVETFQLMTNEGISELLFISDGIWQMEASFYPELPGGEKENMNHQISLCSNLKELATVQIEDKQTNPLWLVVFKMDPKDDLHL